MMVIASGRMPCVDVGVYVGEFVGVAVIACGRVEGVVCVDVGGDSGASSGGVLDDTQLDDSNNRPTRIIHNGLEECLFSMVRPQLFADRVMLTPDNYLALLELLGGVSLR